MSDRQWNRLLRFDSWKRQPHLIFFISHGPWEPCPLIYIFQNIHKSNYGPLIFGYDVFLT